MNREGIYNEGDFREGGIEIDRKAYWFPLETGQHDIRGTVKLLYWGKKMNLIVLLDTEDGKKLKFSFWRNTGYGPEPKGEAQAEKVSARNLRAGDVVKLTYERGENAKVTRIRSLERKLSSNRD
ncbi:MAG: hypothetical protein FWF59_00225 [Turicibacter sp.]|nr:hypothetical protein [Turicibacter sp.]